MKSAHDRTAQRSRLKLLGALAGGAATGGCLADYGDGALQEPPASAAEKKAIADWERRQGIAPPPPASPNREGGGGGGGGGGGSH